MGFCIAVFFERQLCTFKTEAELGFPAPPQLYENPDKRKKLSLRMVKLVM